MALFMISNVAIAASFVFYDSLLPHIASHAEMDRVSTTGLTGALSFDRYGDTTNRAFTLYKVQGTPPAWVAVG